MTAREIGLDVEVKHVNMAVAEQRSPEYKKHNPMGKVPALIDGEVSVWDRWGKSLKIIILVNSFDFPATQFAFI